jgi:hypothetical protein
MTVDQARRWIVTASLLATGATFVFFAVAPVAGYPLTWDQGKRVFEIVLPVFLGYLGSATHFLFHRRRSHNDVTLDDRSGLVGLLVRGPLAIFGLAVVAVLFAFGLGNRLSAPPGSGMSLDTLAWLLTGLTGLLAVTTNVAVAYLFSIESG